MSRGPPHRLRGRPRPPIPPTVRSRRRFRRCATDSRIAPLSPIRDLHARHPRADDHREGAGRRAVPRACWSIGGREQSRRSLYPRIEGRSSDALCPRKSTATSTSIPTAREHGPAAFSTRCRYAARRPRSVVPTDIAGARIVSRYHPRIVERARLTAPNRGPSLSSRAQPLASTTRSATPRVATRPCQLTTRRV